MRTMVKNTKNKIRNLNKTKDYTSLYGKRGVKRTIV